MVSVVSIGSIGGGYICNCTRMQFVGTSSETVFTF